MADGTGYELVWPANQSDANAVRIDTVWTVTNQILVLTSVKSSNPDIVPVGLELRDHIVSISGDQYTFEPASGYEAKDVEKKRHTKLRVKTSAKP